MQTRPTYEEAFCQLGQSWDISAEKLPEITCRMYVPSTDATSVNDLQYHILCSTRRGKFHLVKTTCLCMSFVLTTRLQF